MGDLSFVTPDVSLTVQAIYDFWKKRGQAEPVRRYMGGSSIGLECDRRLWYQFRIGDFEEFEGRMIRLFSRGHREEPVFVEELRGIGCIVHEVDKEGKQFKVTALGGHFAGHMDGAGLGIPEAPKTWHLLEFKTHSAKSFADLKRYGVEKSKPQHYAQMQTYMGLSKGLTRALYMAVNKDTDELYTERIRFDPEFFKVTMGRAKRIIETSTAPLRCATRPDDFRCRYCSFKALCWGTSDRVLPIPQEMLTNRLSVHATPDTERDGRIWRNDEEKRDYTEEELEKPGNELVILPDLLYGCTPIDSGDDWIEYQTEDGVKFKQGNGGFTAKQLTQMTRQQLGELEPDWVGADIPHDLRDRYPHEDSELVWDGPERMLKEAFTKHVPSGLKVGELQQTSEYTAGEYGGKYLVVIYKKHQHGAIWRGKE